MTPPRWLSIGFWVWCVWSHALTVATLVTSWVPFPVVLLHLGLSWGVAGFVGVYVVLFLRRWTPPA